MDYGQFPFGQTGAPGSQPGPDLSWLMQYLPPGLKALMTGSVPQMTPTFPGEPPSGLGAQPPMPGMRVAGMGQPLPMGRPAVAAPVNPGAVATPPGLMPPGVTMPGVPRQQPAASAVPGQFTMDTPTLPAPPMLPTPPRAQGVAKPDFSQTNAWLDKAAPTESGHLAAIMGGMAQGAGGVKRSFEVAPNFSEMLAAIGGGAGQGFQHSNAQHVDYAKTRAGSAMDQTKLSTHVGLENAKIANDGARMAYEANIKNQLMQYEYQLKKHDLSMPKTTVTANGILVAQPGPDGKTTMQFHSTRSQMENLEKVKDLASVMGMPGPYAEAVSVRLLSDMFKGNPVAGQGAMIQLAVNHAINRGAGAQVFGAAYNTAVKEADKLLKQENPTLVSKPLEYQQELNRRVAAVILNQPWINDGKWIPLAARQGILAAQILQSGTASPTEAPPAPTGPSRGGQPAQSPRPRAPAPTMQPIEPRLPGEE